VWLHENDSICISISSLVQPTSSMITFSTRE
jgi:hypothetical protein